METKSALERLNAGEAVHPKDMTDAELMALLPQFGAVVRRATVRAEPVAQPEMKRAA
jgi:hypothetical protein